MPLGTTSKPEKQAEQRKTIRRLVEEMGLKSHESVEVEERMRERLREKLMEKSLICRR